MGTLALMLMLLALPGASTAEQDPRLAQSRGLVAQFQQQLGAHLKAALGEGGPVNAIGVCNQDAPRIAATLAQASGAKVGRTALRVRNAENAPNADAHRILTGFASRVSAGASPPIEHFAVAPDGAARYLAAIVTQPPCLACHGERLAPEVQASIAKYYPDDQATGFAIGDLRGAFMIEWPPGSE